jgi:hypothetical protein
MTRSQAVCEIPMGGSVTHVMHHALLITILLQKLGLFEQSMYLEMSLVKKSPTSCPILRIKYDSAPRQEISELPMSSSTAGLLHLAWGGAGASILEALRTTIIATFLSLRQAMRILRSFQSRY